MKGKSALFWLGLAAAAGGVLFQTSYEVQELEDKLASLNRQIMDEQEAIQILKAEWSYLNDPTRLESLAGQYLALQPTEARQFVAMDVVPMRPVPPLDAAPKADGVAPLPPMVRAPSAAPPVTAVAVNGAITGRAGVIPASLTPGMPTPSKPAPIKPSAIVPGAAKAPPASATQTGGQTSGQAGGSAAATKAVAPAPAQTAKPVDVAARPLAAPAKTLSLPTAKQPQPANVPGTSNTYTAGPAKGVDSIGVLVARLGANR